jgi:hypothetical protein
MPPSGAASGGGCGTVTRLFEASTRPSGITRQIAGEARPTKSALTQYSSLHKGETLFDPNTGKLTFPNPTTVPFVPVISFYAEGSTYVTETCWIEAIGPNYIVVKNKTLDTGDRVSAGSNFTAIIVSAPPPP